MFWEQFGRRIALSAGLSLAAVAVLIAARHGFELTNNYAFGAIYTVSSMVVLAGVSNGPRASIFSAGVGGMIFGIGAASAVNWALGLFVFLQPILYWSTQAAALPSYEQSRFEAERADKIGIVTTLGLFISTGYFLYAVARDLFS